MLITHITYKPHMSDDSHACSNLAFSFSNFLLLLFPQKLRMYLWLRKIYAHILLGHFFMLVCDSSTVIHIHISAMISGAPFSGFFYSSFIFVCFFSIIVRWFHIYNMDMSATLSFCVSFILLISSRYSVNSFFCVHSFRILCSNFPRI